MSCPTESDCTLNKPVCSTGPNCSYGWSSVEGGVSCSKTTSNVIINVADCVNLSSTDLKNELQNTDSQCYQSLIDEVENACGATVNVDTCKQLATGTGCDVTRTTCTQPSWAHNTRWCKHASDTDCCKPSDLPDACKCKY